MIEGIISSTALKLIVCILASYRISNLLVDEEGPFNIFIAFRYVVGVRYMGEKIEKIGTGQMFRNHTMNLRQILTRDYDEMINWSPQYTTELSRLFSCVWCLSVWISFIILALAVLMPDNNIYWFILTAFAVSAGVVLTKTIADG